MTQSVAILGRQPSLGLAELESLYGAEKLTPIGTSAAVLDISPAEVAFNRLGGTVKLAKLLTIIDTTDWQKLEDYLVEHLPDHVCCIPEGKLTLGLSVYDLKVSPRRINATGLTLKKVVRGTERPCRLVPNNEPALSSAQVLHNKLFTSHNWELLLIGSGKQTYLAQTTNVQDIDAYAARDQARPKRDARVGMLPPKLAQIILNLATGPHFIQNGRGLDAAQGSQEERANRTRGTESERQTPADTAVRQENQRVTNSASEQADSAVAVLDPFCGTGVILQESLLMGFDAYGTDLEDRMIDYSKVNLDWLAEMTDLKDRTYLLETGDATNFEWQDFDVIAAETYLGRPFSALPKPDVLSEVMRDVDTIHKKFLKNVARQTKSGFRMCIAVPAWKTPAGFRHLTTLDSLESLGYTRQSFVHAKHDELIYHREGQVVGRELVVLIRK